MTSYLSARLNRLARPEPTTIAIDPRKVGQSSTTRELFKRTEAWLSKTIDPDAPVMGPTREDYVHYMTKTGVRLSPVERNWLVDQANRTGAVDHEGELEYWVICSDGESVNTRTIDQSEVPGTAPGQTTMSGWTPSERAEDQVQRSQRPNSTYWTEDQEHGVYGPVRLLGQVTVKHVTIGGLVTRTEHYYPGWSTKTAARLKGATAGGQATAAKTKVYDSPAAKRKAAKARAKAKAREQGRILKEQRAKERELARKGSVVQQYNA